MDNHDLDAFASEIENGLKLSDDEIRNLLSIEDEEELGKLFYVSRAIRDHFFGNKVFLYSFVYFSTYCKNECAFCYYKNSNQIERYRLNMDDILNLCTILKGEGVHMIDLCMGEDPHFHDNPDNLIELVETVKKELNLPIMISPGVVDNDTLIKLRESGANFLALYQETYDPEHYKKLRVRQSFEERMNCRQFAKEIGYRVEDGILTGIEEDNESVLRSLKEMEKGDPDMVRAMTFTPQEGTPLQGITQQTSIKELKIIAILRLLFPNKLIPASLDLEGIDGMVHRLNAGANVVTSIIPSNSSLEGVVNYDRDYEERDRDVESVVARLKTMGMAPADQSDFEKVLGV